MRSNPTDRAAARDSVPPKKPKKGKSLPEQIDDSLRRRMPPDFQKRVPHRPPWKKSKELA